MGATPDRGERLPRRLRTALRRLHARSLHPVLSFLLPAGCFVCGEPLPPTHLLGACLGCWADLSLLVRTCPACATPLPRSTDLSGPPGRRCVACAAGPRSFEAALALVSYDERARRFVLRAKLDGRPELLRRFGLLLARRVELTGFHRPCSLVVPVPSHPWSRLRRGFDPAREVARAVSRALGLPLTTRLRRRWVPPIDAKRLGAHRRRALLRGAFLARGTFRGQHVLLIDDVLTTGASAEACARALLSRGAEGVRVAVWARTPDPR